VPVGHPPAFSVDSEWWDRPAYESCPRRRSGQLGNAEYDYAADPYPQQQVPYWVLPPPEEEEAEEANEVVDAPVLPVEQYQPPDLSEEALRRAIEESELVDLGNWVGLGAQLAALTSTSHASASTSRTAPPPPPLHHQLPSPSPGATPSGRRLLARFPFM
jgi:hypothetical protein